MQMPSKEPRTTVRAKAKQRQAEQGGDGDAEEAV